MLSKRKDGYHNIETIFYPIKLHDNISVYISPSIKSKLTVKTLSKNKKLNIDDNNNICYKAVKLFFERFNIKGYYNIKIIIRKNIPVGAGLGGGSSNAASVLRVLSKHFKNQYTSPPNGGRYRRGQSLHYLALELGSDVPFFLYGKPAYATGRGEKLIPLPKFKVNYKIQILNPGVNVSTAWAYKQLKIRNYELRIKKHLSKIKTFTLSEKDKFVNDFEKVVFKKHPAIKKLKQKMYDDGAVFASMSGSGSTMYGLFKNKKQ